MTNQDPSQAYLSVITCALRLLINRQSFTQSHFTFCLLSNTPSSHSCVLCKRYFVPFSQNIVKDSSLSFPGSLQQTQVGDCSELLR